VKAALAIAGVMALLGLAYYAGASNPETSKAWSTLGVDTARIIVMTKP
jgi:hypothetical protein